MAVKDPEVRKILQKYEQKLGENVETNDYSEFESSANFSREYEIFRREALNNKITFYEFLCNIAEGIIKINPGEKKKIKIQKSINMAHLNINPEGAASLSALTSVLFVLIGIAIGVTRFLNAGSLDSFEVTKLTLPLFFLLLGLLINRPLLNIPNYVAAKWRLRASNQMVLCVLYVVMYMRHTSNLEHAILFATEHIKDPLALDLRNVFWNVETGKFATIRESLDHYLQGWRDWNLEFVNSFHLIESSLYEPTEGRRLELLDKALDVILNGTYEKMLHYAQGLKNPITTLHMLGIVLPILGLVIFPLIGSFLGGLVQWYHLAILYNLLLPSIVYFFGKNILSKRPTGYGQEASGYRVRQNPMFFSVVIIVFFIGIGILPLILHSIDPSTDIFLGDSLGNFLDYKGDKGPYGIGALLLSFCIPFGIAIGLSVYYKLKSNKFMKMRKETKELENEFSNSLFQLGNRVGDGVPAEIAFDKVAENMRGTPTGDFFSYVSSNIQKLGMSLKEALFNQKNGALLYFPSDLIRSSMEVLVESAKKGPKVVASSLISIANHISEIHKVNERLKDLLSEIISSMKSQISFLAPLIAGIVVGISSMIVVIIGKVGDLFAQSQASSDAAFTGGLSTVNELFNIQDVIPTYQFQIVVGLYVVQMVYILTVLANGIENGSDKLNEDYMLGKNLLKSSLLYVIVAGVVTLIFTALALSILTGIASPV